MIYNTKSHFSNEEEAPFDEKPTYLRFPSGDNRPPPFDSFMESDPSSKHFPFIFDSEFSDIISEGIKEEIASLTTASSFTDTIESSGASSIPTVEPTPTLRTTGTIETEIVTVNSNDKQEYVSFIMRRSKPMSYHDRICTPCILNETEDGFCCSIVGPVEQPDEYRPGMPVEEHKEIEEDEDTHDMHNKKKSSIFDLFSCGQGREVKRAAREVYAFTHFFLSKVFKSHDDHHTWK